MNNVASKRTEIHVLAAKYADSDDCLADAERDYAEAHDLEGWDLSPRWADDERETILLSVPAESTAERLARAAAHIEAIDLGDDRWAHYADETSRWYVVTANELEELCDYLDDDDEQISRDAYSHWCAGTSGEEMAKGWEPGADDEVTIVASISDGMSRNGGGQTTITADTMAGAIEQAEEWCREGDYTTEGGGNVDVRLCIADSAGEIIEWRTVSCDAEAAS